MSDRPKCLQLVKTFISINEKEAQPNDDPNKKHFCNITYIFTWDTAGQACCTMAMTELQHSEKKEPYLRTATGYACTIRMMQQNGMPVYQYRPAHDNQSGPNVWPANSKWPHNVKERV